MVRYSDEIIEEIKNRNDIVSIVSQYVVLKKSGRNFSGLCPFHQEKTPSFIVSPAKQIFHCFGCNEGGNVITFLKKVENISFSETVEMLADKAGIKLEIIGNNEQDINKQRLKEKVYEINEEVAEFYHQELYKQDSKLAQEYVKKRKLDNKTLKKFHIGYAPRNNVLYKLLKEKKYTDEEIISSDLVTKYNNKYIDKFRNRLIFPIQDTRDRIIAFGGRVLDTSLPKYINSSENIVYSKARTLYGLNVAKNTKNKNIIIVEGYMDTVSLNQRGIDNVVASCGTALTESQGRLLRKYVEKVIISYDSDMAGQTATIRGLDILTNLGCDVRILQMTGAKDPDEFVIKYGNVAFNKLVENAISLVEFKVKVAKKDMNLENANDKIKFLSEVSKILTSLESKIEQEVYIDKISKDYKISKEAIYAEINRKSYAKSGEKKILEKNYSKLPKKERQQIPEAINKREKFVISLLANCNIETYKKIKKEISPEDFKIEINRRILEKLYEEYENGDINISNIMDKMEEELTNSLTAILAEEYEVDNSEKALEDLIKTYQKEKLINEKNTILTQLNNSNDKEEIKKLEICLQETIIRIAKIK